MNEPSLMRARQRHFSHMTAATESRAVVTWTGAGQPIMLTVYGPDGEVATVPLTPVRALELAQELTRPAVVAIKTAQWGPGWPG